VNLTSTPPTRRRHHPLARSVLGPLALAALLVIGCRTVDKSFVWSDTYQGSAAEGPYLIAPGDTLSVRVFNQDAISGNVRVRSDGMITVPFLNDVEAEGSTPSQLAERLQTRLAGFLVNPVVTVALQETRPLEVSVLGEVQRSGLYRLEAGPACSLRWPPPVASTTTPIASGSSWSETGPIASASRMWRSPRPGVGQPSSSCSQATSSSSSDDPCRSSWHLGSGRSWLRLA
jgi:hypothetical protein